MDMAGLSSFQQEIYIQCIYMLFNANWGHKFKYGIYFSFAL